MRTASLLLLLAAFAPAQEIRLKIARDLAADDFIRQIHMATGKPILFPPAETLGKKVKGEYDMNVPRESVRDVLVFILSTCGLEVRRLDPFTVVLPGNALVTEFRATGLETKLEFNRSPAGWRRVGDMAGSLSAKSVQALIGEAVGGRRHALELIGYAAPRDRRTADALLELLKGQDARVHAEAARALGRCGYPARPLLGELRKLDGFPELAEAIDRIERAYHPALLNPALAKERAPNVFTARFDTTQGEILVEVRREWAPVAADRFYNLVRIGFFDGARFFRVIDGFVAQFGKTPDPEVNKAWYNANLKDEPVVKSNQRGYFSFAKSNEPDSRSTQVFINLEDNKRLDGMGFAPFGVITQGLDVADRLYSGYGDTPRQNTIHYKGEEYLAKNFPKLDKIKSARIVK